MSITIGDKIQISNGKQKEMCCLYLFPGFLALRHWLPSQAT
jgi:hypothetical protein